RLVLNIRTIVRTSVTTVTHADPSAPYFGMKTMLSATFAAAPMPEYSASRHCNWRIGEIYPASEPKQIETNAIISTGSTAAVARYPGPYSRLTICPDRAIDPASTGSAITAIVSAQICTRRRTRAGFSRCEAESTGKNDDITAAGRNSNGVRNR